MDDRSEVGAVVSGDARQHTIDRLLQAPAFAGWTAEALLSQAVTLEAGDLLEWGRAHADLIVEFEAQRLAQPRADSLLRVEKGVVRQLPLHLQDLAPTLMALPNIRMPIGTGLLLSSDGQVFKTKNDAASDYMRRLPPLLEADAEAKYALCAPLPPVLRTIPEAIYLHTGSKYFAMRLIALAGVATAREVIKTSRIPFVVETKMAPGPVELELIRRLGFGDNEIIQVTKAPTTLIERLWFPFVPIYQQTTFTTSTVAMDQFRKHLGIKPRSRAARGDRIYVSRGDAPWRRVANEQEVLETLAPYGFRAVRFGGKSGPECIEELRNAEIVVGLTGSSLFNALFAPPDTWVVEVTPNGYERNGFKDYGAGVYASFRQNVIQTSGDLIEDNRRFTHWDVNVSREELKVAVEYALERIAGG